MKSKLMVAFFCPCAFNLTAKRHTQRTQSAGAWYKIAKQVEAVASAMINVRFAPARLSFMPAVWGDYQTQREYS